MRVWVACVHLPRVAVEVDAHSRIARREQQVVGTNGVLEVLEEEPRHVLCASTQQREEVWAAGSAMPSTRANPWMLPTWNSSTEKRGR